MIVNTANVRTQLARRRRHTDGELYLLHARLLAQSWVGRALMWLVKLAPAGGDTVNAMVCASKYGQFARQKNVRQKEWRWICQSWWGADSSAQCCSIARPRGWYWFVGDFVVTCAGPALGAWHVAPGAAVVAAWLAAVGTTAAEA